MARIAAFEKTEQKTMRWLKGIADALGSTDLERSYMILRAVLHALRDRLTPDEAVQLGAQLPMLVRGFYYEGWHPADKPRRYRHKERFLEQVSKEVPSLDYVQLERAIGAVFETLLSEIGGGEIDQVRSALPAELREMWALPGL